MHVPLLASLHHATHPTDRSKAWRAQALAVDDPQALSSALDRACDALQIAAPQLLTELETGLWRPSRGAGPDGKRRGLVAVASGNKRGVPEAGAIRCLEELMRRFPCVRSNATEMAFALGRARELGRTGVEEVLMEKRSYAGPTEAGPCVAEVREYWEESVCAHACVYAYALAQTR